MESILRKGMAVGAGKRNEINGERFRRVETMEKSPLSAMKGKKALRRKTLRRRKRKEPPRMEL